MLVKSLVRYLGDLFNEIGNKSALIQDRITKGKGRVNEIFTLAFEVTSGVHMIDTLLLLYDAYFLPTILFNCQAWSKLLESEFKKLSVIQLKFLKKVLMAPRSTPNAAVLLELGILPIKEEVNKRRLGFLYHILNLEPEYPVQRMFMIQKEFKFEENWANEILECLKHYEMDFTLDEIRSTKKEHWKVVVKKKLKKNAFDISQREAGAKERTSHLKFKDLSCQEYVKNFGDEQVRMIFKIKNNMINPEKE